MLPGGPASGPARWRFFHPNGWELQPLPPPLMSPLSELVHPTEKLLARWAGERFDLHTTVEVLCGIRRGHDSAESCALGDGRDEISLLGTEPGG